MEFSIEANISDMPEEFHEDGLETFYFFRRTSAETVFRYLLDTGIRPIRLLDRFNNVIMSAEKGIRTGC